MIVISRKPTHPGEMLREEFMPDYNLSVANLATRLGVSRQSVNELVHERRALSTEMALRLSRLFGNTAAFWLNLQRDADIWNAMDACETDLSEITPIVKPA